jgi:hypothetical protein
MYTEKLLPLPKSIRSVYQIFNGKRGIWITTRGGKKLFLPAEKLTQRLEDGMMKAKATRIDDFNFGEHGGSDTVFVNLSDGIGPAVYKPSTGPRDVGFVFEKDAFDISKILGMNAISNTVIRQGVLGSRDMGSLQLYVPLAKAAEKYIKEVDVIQTAKMGQRYHLGTKYTESNVFKRIVSNDVLRESAAFDILTNGSDRSTVNALVTKQGQLVLIDHSLIFNYKNTSVNSFLVQLAQDRGLKLGSLQHWLKKENAFKPIMKKHSDTHGPGFFKRYQQLSTGIKEDMSILEFFEKMGIKNVAKILAPVKDG